MTLRLVPVDYTDAVRFVEAWHRHNDPPPGHKFSVGVADDSDILRGVAIIGRPISRILDDGQTLEVNRTATDGYPNANSMLYAAAARATFAMGYRRLITYTQGTESGSSLRAAGWHVVASKPPRDNWNTPARPRDGSSYLAVTRTLWEAPA